MNAVERATTFVPDWTRHAGAKGDGEGLQRLAFKVLGNRRVGAMTMARGPLALLKAWVRQNERAVGATLVPEPADVVVRNDHGDWVKLVAEPSQWGRPEGGCECQPTPLPATSDRINVQLSAELFQAEVSGRLPRWEVGP